MLDLVLCILASWLPTLEVIGSAGWLHCIPVIQLLNRKGEFSLFTEMPKEYFPACQWQRFARHLRSVKGTVYMLLGLLQRERVYEEIVRSRVENWSD
jgi:hypothetical protein